LAGTVAAAVSPHERSPLRRTTRHPVMRRLVERVAATQRRAWPYALRAQPSPFTI
jgi:predicted component of type VI protein secretion system